MILLVSTTCSFCEDVANVDKEYKNINKFFVVEGVADVNGSAIPLAAEITELPCLIDGSKYIFRSNTILEYLKISGEINAATSIL